MEKDNFYKYTLIGALGGTALAFLYLKTLGKDKALDLTKTLLIGGVAGAGLGLLSDVVAKGGVKIKEGVTPEKPLVTEQTVRDFAKSLGIDDELKINSYLLILNQVPHTAEQKQRVLNVLDATLRAKRDKKWDESATLTAKKEILVKNYGITDAEWNVFQQITSANLANLIVNALGN